MAPKAIDERDGRGIGKLSFPQITLSAHPMDPKLFFRVSIAALLSSVGKQTAHITQTLQHPIHSDYQNHYIWL